MCAWHAGTGVLFGEVLGFDARDERVAAAQGRGSARTRETETNAAPAAAHSAAGVPRQLLARLADVSGGGFLHVRPSPGLARGTATATATSGCAHELRLRAAFSRYLSHWFSLYCVKCPEISCLFSLIYNTNLNMA